MFVQSLSVTPQGIKHRLHTRRHAQARHLGNVSIVEHLGVLKAVTARAKYLNSELGRSASECGHDDVGCGVANDVEAGLHARTYTRPDVGKGIVGGQVLSAVGVFQWLTAGRIKIAMAKTGSAGANGAVNEEIAARANSAEFLCPLHSPGACELTPVPGNQGTGYCGALGQERTQIILSGDNWARHLLQGDDAKGCGVSSGAPVRRLGLRCTNGSQGYRSHGVMSLPADNTSVGPAVKAANFGNLGE